MAEITDAGFLLKTQNEYFEEERQLYLDIDADWNLDPSTPDGLKIAHDSEIFANLDEVAQRAYNSKNPNAAKGHDLDVLCALTKTKRDLGVPSRAGVICKGVEGTQILAGDLVESIDNNQWVIDNTVTIAANGEVAANVTCTVNGDITAAIGTINKIKTTRGGWQSVSNPQIAVVGRGKQTDVDLRLERERGVARNGSNMVESIYGEVSAVDGVRRVAVYENEEKTADDDGLPGNSICVIVDGGTDADVAQAIYNKRGPGTKQYQPATPVDIMVTSKKFPKLKKLIKFNRPDYSDAIIVVTVKDDGTLPADIDDEIKNAIIDYTNGELLPASVGFNPLGFDIAEDVPAGRFYTPVNSVIGKYGDSYTQSITVNGGAVLTVDFKSLARFGVSNITVNKV